MTGDIGQALVRRWWRRRESNPQASFSNSSTSDTEAEQTPANQSVIDSGELCADQNPDTSVQLPSTSLHLKRVPEEYQNPPADLANVAAAWDELSANAKQQIVEIVKAETYEK